jgi:YesN/AraC family two-component response regulator
MNCSTFRTHWVNYTDLSSYNDYLLAAGEITTEQQEQALVVEMLQQYCDRVARYSTAGYSVVIRNIIHYINLHLKEDLTLSTLAARFNLSRSYLSDRLHREVHSNLTDYVTLARIQFAANLLRYHHYTIAQAAQDVGIPVVPYPPVQAHHRRDAVPLRPVESHRGLRDEPAKKKNFAAALRLLAMLCSMVL